MKTLYSPGCALMIYKPHMVKKIQEALSIEFGVFDEYTQCCKQVPDLIGSNRIINTCPGCDRRFRELYDGISTVSLWEILATSKQFPFPDYQAIEMTVHDACPVRTESRVHDAIRLLLDRMNIKVVETKNNRAHSICCGDDFYPQLTISKVKKQMKKRAAEMPREDVVVYCVSCVKSIYIGGKTPRYIPDLLFDEPTEIGIYETEAWHKQINDYANTHMKI
jgi:Fe-S oxidoreductase